MIWILSILTLCSVNASGLKTDFSTKESYDILFGEDNTIHATTHITNIIRNGTEDLTTSEIKNLEQLGILSQNGEISTFTPNNLDQTAYKVQIETGTNRFLSIKTLTVEPTFA